MLTNKTSPGSLRPFAYAILPPSSAAADAATDVDDDVDNENLVRNMADSPGVMNWHAPEYVC